MAVSGRESPVQSLLFHSVTQPSDTNGPSPFFEGSIDDIDKETTYLQDDLSFLPKSSHVCWSFVLTISHFSVLLPTIGSSFDLLHPLLVLKDYLRSTASDTDVCLR